MAQVCLSSLEHPSTSRYLPGPAITGLHAVSVCVCGMLERHMCLGCADMQSANQHACVVGVFHGLCVLWDGHRACLYMTPGLWLQHFKQSH